jgi:hypothetical protein
MIATKNQECRLIVPVSKKAISAVGIDEKCVYAARFEDGLLIIGDLLEGFTESIFEHGKEIEGVSLLDIAPTIAKLLGIPPEQEWEGKSVL